MTKLPLHFPSNFNETDYLDANPDVRLAVESCAIASGRTHYETFGIFENRALRPGVRATPLRYPFAAGFIPQRRDKVLANLDLNSMVGLEIGALSSPLVTKLEGNISFVDHTDTDGLREIYRGHPGVEISEIVTVDGVWGRQSLRECLGKKKEFDYVIASHVVEHVPDLITWLEEIAEVLRMGGVLRLVIPDKRYTFDRIRAETRPHDVLAAYVERRRTPSPRAIIEHHSLACFVEPKQIWSACVDPGTFVPYSTTKIGLELAFDTFKNETYHDVHCWVFTPVSFLELCLNLSELSLFPFSFDYLIETEKNESEFFVGMRLADEDPQSQSAGWRSARSRLLQP